jgi:hypothetical protein
MFGTFRKHSTWLWSIIIAAVAIGMVAYFGPTNQTASSVFSGPSALGQIGGNDITHEDFLNAQAEAKLQFLMMRGEWPGPGAERQGFDLELETYKRLFIIQKQKEFGIEVSMDQVAKTAAENLRSMSRDGATVTMAQFEATVLKEGPVTLADYEQFLRHQIGLQQLIAAVSVSGKLVTEKEARAVYERENRERSGQAAFFTASNYLSQVKATPEALSNFYSNQVARYRLPDRIQVSYVEFKLTNYWAEAEAEMAKLTNLTAILDGVYAQRGGTNHYRELTPEAAKAEIKAEFHGQLALRAASRAANQFADPILSAKTIKAEMLAAEAAKAGLTMQLSTPFDRNSTPEGMEVSEQFVRAAFALREDDPIAGPIASESAIYLFTKHKDIPSELQSYDKVKAKVAEDFKQSEALQAARTAATDFVTAATNALAKGKAFTSVCAEARVKPVLLPPFSQSTRALPEIEEHMSLQQFKQIGFGIKVGEVSPAVPIMEGSMVAYVQSELPLDEKKMAADLPEFLKMFRQARQQEAFDEWFGREAQAALATTPPIMRQRNQAPNVPNTAN